VSVLQLSVCVNPSTRIPQLKSKVHSQVAVNPNEFLYYQQDSIHHVQLRRSSELVTQDIDYQYVSGTGFLDSVATAESGINHRYLLCRNMSTIKCPCPHDGSAPSRRPFLPNVQFNSCLPPSPDESVLRATKSLTGCGKPLRSSFESLRTNGAFSESTEIFRSC